MPSDEITLLRLELIDTQKRLLEAQLNLLYYKELELTGKIGQQPVLSEQKKE